MEIAIITLGIVVIGQIIERHLYATDMNQKLQDCIKAVLSRNINEYITATTTPKSQPEPTPESDEVELNSQTEDEVFQKFLKHAS